jgi:hypothetical protein
MLRFRCRLLRFLRDGDRAPVVEIACPSRLSPASGTVASLQSTAGAMDVLASLGVAGRAIDFGVATTRGERAAVLAQRFRVYQRRGYYRLGVTVDRDAYDEQAVYVLAMLRDREVGDVMVGSARMVLGEAEACFRFLYWHAVQLELPKALRAIPARQCLEVSRRPNPKRPRRRLPGRPRIRRGPKEVALAGTVRLRSAMRQLPEPSLCPFFTHVCCVAERCADTRADDRAPRSIAEATDATASASERTNT